MKTIGVGTVAAALFVFAGASAGQLAHAQTAADDEYRGDNDRVTTDTPDTVDPRPEAPQPIVGAERPPIRQQAGIGSDISFARAGVIELGGSAGLTLASDFTSFNLSPSVGYFIADNLQVSVLSGINYIKTGGFDSTFAQLLLEPSYHLPLNDMLFVFLGMGFGGTYAKDVDFGFAVAPRLGMKVMVGRSGILTPSISWLYSTNDLATGSAPGPGQTATTTATISSAAVFNIGYTVMW